MHISGSVGRVSGLGTVVLRAPPRSSRQRFRRITAKIERPRYRFLGWRAIDAPEIAPAEAASTPTNADEIGISAEAIGRSEMRIRP
mmetsp:Transcript_14768/g.34305  ORF Transcript_14768/g.34305 Transcript_14768/m.34305 type:complete len:86 (+) Transcript_14768:255-512(+)